MVIHSSYACIAYLTMMKQWRLHTLTLVTVRWALWICFIVGLNHSWTCPHCLDVRPQHKNCRESERNRSLPVTPSMMKIHKSFKNNQRHNEDNWYCIHRSEPKRSRLCSEQHSLRFVVEITFFTRFGNLTSQISEFGPLDNTKTSFLDRSMTQDLNSNLSRWQFPFICVLTVKLRINCDSNYVFLRVLGISRLKYSSSNLWQHENLVSQPKYDSRLEL